MDQQNVTRRSVVQGAGLVGLGVVGAGALAACGDSSTPAAGDGAAASSTTSTAPGSSSSSAGGVSVKTADVPVGGGTIIATSLVVVTQPKAGEFKAFSAICTHQKCPVTEIANGTIDCKCHGSKYDITTGAVVAGPAPSPLAAKTATVSGDTVTVS
ncbi:MAG TPA: Rieske (2Fe-2S) protein [Candidatus Lustribacter sp.]|nr:Rieske (2Fe-2S) protein [Candidatus Lustribacter sp.]